MAPLEQLDQTFLAIADPTRRAILTRLRDGEARVTDLAAPFDMSLNGVSKHVRILERAGLVQRRIEGRVHHISFDARPLTEAADWIETQRRFWEERLDGLERFLMQQSRDDERSDP